MKNEYYDASEVKQEIAPQIEDIIKDLFPTAKREGRDMRVGDIEGAKGRSLSISTRPDKFGAWFDHSSEQRGDIISLVMEKHALSYAETLKHLAEKYTNLQPVKQHLNFTGNKVKEIKTIDVSTMCSQLTQQCIDYSENTRKVSKSVLDSYMVKSGSQDNPEMAFLSFIKKDCVKIHYSRIDVKEFRSTKDPIHTLFGKHYATPQRCKGVLVITEGQWDAMSYAEVGIPAVSIPSGVSNMKWIDTDWDYISQFHTFYLSFDMDESGDNAIEKVVSRLGVNKCNIVKLPKKDASDVLQELPIMKAKPELHSAIENAEPFKPTEISSISSLADEAWEMSSIDRSKVGTEFFLPIPFRIRKHEMTLYTGFRGHGKSQVVLNQVAFMFKKGIPSMVGSFESTGSTVLADVTKQYVGVDRFENRDHFDKSINKLNDLLYIYNSNTRPTPKQLIECFIYAHKRYGVFHFVVDNVATMKMDRGDNTEQAEAANSFREFVREYPVHLSVVAHPRKSSDSGYEEPPHEGDVRGASEWTDLSENVVCVWRNKKKAELVANAIKDNLHQSQVMMAKEMKDGQVIVRKQRFTGEDCFVDTWFDRDLKVFNDSSAYRGGFETKEEPNKKVYQMAK